MVSVWNSSAMESSRVFLLSLLLGMIVVQCLANTDSCGPQERSNPEGKCQRTCNACRDCGPCLCKTGYIRISQGGDCILDQECHSMHLKWVHDAKYSNSKDKFFNCD